MGLGAAGSESPMGRAGWLGEVGLAGTRLCIPFCAHSCGAALPLGMVGEGDWKGMLENGGLAPVWRLPSPPVISEHLQGQRYLSRPCLVLL